MSLSDEQRVDLEIKISDGITPPCPICGSSLIVTAEQVGKSGANGRNYHCSKDRLLPEQGAQCDLTPGIAYINWKQNLRQTLRNRIVQLSLAGIASISIVGYGGVKAGFIEIGGDKSDTTIVVDDQEWKNKIATKDKTIRELKGQIADLEKKAPDKEPINQLEEPKWKLGYALATKHEYSNFTRGRDWLAEGLDNGMVSSDNDRKEVLKKLNTIQKRNSDENDWEFLKNQLLTDASFERLERHLLLAEAYYNLQLHTGDEDALKLSFIDSAMCYYSCAISKMGTEDKRKEQAYKDAIALLPLWYGNANLPASMDSLKLKIHEHNSTRNICH